MHNVKLIVDHFSIEFQDPEDCEDDRISFPKELYGEPSSAGSQADISGDEFVTRINTHKGSSHRKHHIPWTPAEVMKLIEGVSQCGVGRWAKIKRQMFSSSSRRTSVDLKVVNGIILLVCSIFCPLETEILIFFLNFQDKWRNLLRASCTELQSKKKVGLELVLLVVALMSWKNTFVTILKLMTEFELILFGISRSLLT